MLYACRGSACSLARPLLLRSADGAAGVLETVTAGRDSSFVLSLLRTEGYMYICRLALDLRTQLSYIDIRHVWNYVEVLSVVSLSCILPQSPEDGKKNKNKQKSPQPGWLRVAVAVTTTFFTKLFPL